MKNNLFLIILCIFIFGCGTPYSKVYTTKEDVKAIRENIQTNTEEIIKETEKIDAEVKNINENATKVEMESETTPQIKTHIDSIKQSSDVISESSSTIKTATTEIASVNPVLEKAESDIKLMQKDIIKLREEKDKAIKERDSQIRKMLHLLIVFSIVGAVVSGVIFFYTNSKWGLIISLSCIITMTVALFVEAYLSYLIYFGGAIFVAIIAFLIYSVYKQRKTLIIKEKALKEVVNTVEVAKANMTPDAKKKVFGASGEVGEMSLIQSNQTMEIVKSLKKDLPELWKYSKKNKE